MKKWPILCFFLLSGLFTDAQKWQFGTDLFSQRKVFFEANGDDTSFFDKNQLLRGDLMVNFLLQKNWALRAKIDPVDKWVDKANFEGSITGVGRKGKFHGWRASIGVENGWNFGRFKPFAFLDLEYTAGKKEINLALIDGFGPRPANYHTEETNKKLNENLGLGLEFYLSKRFSLRAESAFQNSFGWSHLSDGAGELDFRERNFRFWWLNSFGAFVRF